MLQPESRKGKKLQKSLIPAPSMESDHTLIQELILIEYRETRASDLILYIHINAKERVGKAHK